MNSDSLAVLNFCIHGNIKRRIVDRNFISLWVPISLRADVSQGKQMQAVVCHGNLVLSMPAVVQEITSSSAFTGPWASLLSRASRNYLIRGLCELSQPSEVWHFYAGVLVLFSVESGILALIFIDTPSPAQISIKLFWMHRIRTSPWQTSFSMVTDGKKLENMQ